jgi:hypothetical protein
MKDLHVVSALSLACAGYAHAQISATHDSTLEEARFPVSRGSNFTFQPSSGSLCYWAVAQYPDESQEFFRLQPQPVCPRSVANVSTTLRLRFGAGLQTGNATLTVQCNEPSVWNFFINEAESDYEGHTAIEPICEEEDDSTSGTASPSQPFNSYNDTAGGNGIATGSFKSFRPSGTSAIFQGNQSFVVPSTFATSTASFGPPLQSSDSISQPQVVGSSGLDSPYSSVPQPHSILTNGFGSPDSHETGWRPSGSATEQSMHSASVTSSSVSNPAAQSQHDMASSGVPFAGDSEPTEQLGKQEAGQAPSTRTGVPDTTTSPNSADLLPPDNSAYSDMGALPTSALSAVSDKAALSSTASTIVPTNPSLQLGDANITRLSPNDATSSGCVCTC